jgi:hypothetical protein
VAFQQYDRELHKNPPVFGNHRYATHSRSHLQFHMNEINRATFLQVLPGIHKMASATPRCSNRLESMQGCGKGPNEAFFSSRSLVLAGGFPCIVTRQPGQTTLGQSEMHPISPAYIEGCTKWRCCGGLEPSEGGNSTSATLYHSHRTQPACSLRFTQTPSTALSMCAPR